MRHLKERCYPLLVKSKKGEYHVRLLNKKKRLLALPLIRIGLESFPSYDSSVLQPFLYQAAAFLFLLMHEV
jgi:hypothetical protein